MQIRSFAIVFWVLVATATFGAQNLLRNGSFEGGLLYWHNVDTNQHTLAAKAKVGEYALKLTGGYVMSAPVVMERGKVYTISLWAKGDAPGRVSVAMPPSAREVGQKAGRLWTKGAGRDRDIGTDWTRVSFTFPADVGQTGFWPQPHYLIQISGNKGNTVYVDGVTVTEGTEGTPQYIARTAVEIVADCMNLPGFDGAKGNIFDVGDAAEMRANVSNPGPDERTVTVRWQLIDYEGVTPVAKPIEKTVTLASGQCYSETVPLKLDHKGCVVARLSVHDVNGTLIDKSEIPITSLPYPKHATTPDWRERYGGSWAGDASCMDKLQRIGFGWSRWWPRNKWHNFEPEEGKYNWQDEKFEEAFKRGISCHVVLYGWPKWIMDKDHPLPRDMRWKADDPRWEDLSVVTAWDRFVRDCVDHFRGKSVIFQIANEPGHDKWGNFKDEYVKFNLRTTRLIKQTDPGAKVSINNVYLNPSAVNYRFLQTQDCFKDIDVWSWHDYHAGKLLSVTGIKQMRNMLDAAGGKHLEIWFTEGWAFTNTRVDEPIGCTHLDSVQGTHAAMQSMAELAANGQDKTIMFHLLYADHGHSFWDYSGPGTMLWDWYGYPLPLVASWNVMIHHIGISRETGFIRPVDANLCIFDDQRNGKGVIIAFTDEDAKADVTLPLPDVGGQWIAEDIMGNQTRVSGEITLNSTGRPVYLYTTVKTDGATLLKAFEPRDRKHASFVSAGGAGRKSWRLPASWEGTTKGTTTGNPVEAGGKPIWRLDRVIPSDPLFSQNYMATEWDGTQWFTAKHSQGGNPKARIDGSTLYFSALGPWANTEYQKAIALVFIAPENGTYKVSGTARAKPWTGRDKSFTLSVRKKDTQRAPEIQAIKLPRDNSPVPINVTIDLSQGHELVFLPLMPNWNNACNFRIDDLVIAKE